MISRRRASGLRRSLAIVIGLAAILGPTAHVQATTTWIRNLYVSKAFMYQDPYGSACTAAATMTMLNTIAYRHTGGTGFRWTPTRVQNSSDRSNTRDMTSVLYFARAHDTLSPSGSGSDPHGWRNALNYYGWSLAAMTGSAKSIYRDLEFTSFDAAVHAAVRAIARHGMPVGIVTWAGRHAQVMTGYEVSGANPAESDSFTVRAVYISDPLRADGAVNLRVSYTTLKSGTIRLRFQRYRETDSPYDDVYVGGWKRSSVAPTRGPSEWYGKWVVILPVRDGLPVDPPPPPDPTPTPAPTPTPPATPTATPDPTPTATVGAAATPDPTPLEAPSATPSASATADASTSASPREAPSTAP
ncbi:MAG: hypothetical protein H0V73_02970 [Chloroflexi bacterium]|nr:hypothetical protein [Chloroflexota bacterium]